MKKALPWLLIILGGLLALTGIGLALMQLSSLYDSVLDKPLDLPDGFEKHSADQMLRYAIIAAPGAVMVLIGKIMLKRRRAKRDARARS